MKTIDDIAELVSAQHGIPKAQAHTIIRAAFNNISGSLANNEAVTIHGFGKFEVKGTKARTGRNPQTGETINIPAKNKLVFTPAKAVKDALNK